MQNLRRPFRPVGGCQAQVSINHHRPPNERYLVSILVDTVGDDRDLVRPPASDNPYLDPTSQFMLNAWAFMDDFGSLIYTTRFV